MLCDQEVVSFSDSGYILHNTKLLPPFLRTRFHTKDLIAWIKARSISTSRKGYELLSKHVHLSEDTWHCASVSDSYWIRSSISQKWKDISLYRNFSEYIGNILLGTIPRVFPDKKSPEWTTIGLYQKAWIQRQDKIFLKKLDGFEREYKAYEIAKILNISCQTVHMNKFFCVCENFTNEEVSLIPYKYSGLSIEEIESRFSKDFYNMILFDYIIYNRDRHDENWGFLMNNKTGELICMAPLYDHNLAMYSNEEDEILASQIFITKSLYQSARDILRKNCMSATNIELEDKDCNERLQKLLKMQEKDSSLSNLFQ